MRTEKQYKWRFRCTLLKSNKQYKLTRGFSWCPVGLYYTAGYIITINKAKGRKISRKRFKISEVSVIMWLDRPPQQF